MANDICSLNNRIRGLVDDLGYELVGLEVVKEYGNLVLRIYIDSANGIVVRDCETVSRRVSKFLDEHEETFKEKYFLEVSSPGLDRPLFVLADFTRFVARTVKIKMKDNVGGCRSLKGKIQSVKDDNSIIILDLNGNLHQLLFADIAKARLIYEEGQRETC